jgi:hypothetical protein
VNENETFISLLNLHSERRAGKMGSHVGFRSIYLTCQSVKGQL